MFCKQCGTGNDLQAKYCIDCGTELPAIGNIAPAKSGNEVQSVRLSHKEAEMLNKQSLYRTIIGDKNQEYYLYKFLEFDRTGIRRFSWHWPGFFFTFYWMLYRKMWLDALLYFAIPYIIVLGLALISIITGNKTDNLAGFLYILFLFAIWFIPPLYINSWYYKHCNQLIADSYLQTSNSEQQIGLLKAKGGTSQAALIIILIMSLLSVIGLVAALAIPAYEDYMTRAKTVQALATGQQITKSVDRYYAQRRRLPENLLATDFPMVFPPEIRDVEFDKNKGIISISINTSGQRAQQLLFIPKSIDTNIQWYCTAKGLKSSSVPMACRGHNPLK